MLFKPEPPLVWFTSKCNDVDLLLRLYGEDGWHDGSAVVVLRPTGPPMSPDAQSLFIGAVLR